MARINGNTANHLEIGTQGEKEALCYLARNGFRLLSRNWRPKGSNNRLELDLIGRWEQALVFVEVKTRRAVTADQTDEPSGLYGFTPAKQRAMLRAAHAYLAENDLWDMPCRCDLVCITLLPGLTPQVDHYRDVIEFGKALDSGNAPWQPW